jgi:hypothetical protein
VGVLRNFIWGEVFSSFLICTFVVELSVKWYTRKKRELGVGSFLHFLI